MLKFQYRKLRAPNVTPQVYPLVMNKSHCPLENHFHVSLTNALQSTTDYLVISTERPEDALAFAISSLPADWVGGVEVCDDETLTPDSMPLIDYWHEPVRTA